MFRNAPIDRRKFLAQTSAATVALTAGAGAFADASAGTSAESLVGQLFTSLSDKQQEKICFDWDHVDAERGLLRSYVSANWNITEPSVVDDFYNEEQRELIKGVFESIVHPGLACTLLSTT